MPRLNARTLMTTIALTLAFAAVPALAQSTDDAATRFVIQDVQEQIQTESLQFEIPEIETDGRAFIGGGGPSFWGAFFELDELNEALDAVDEFTGDFQFGDRSAYLLKGGAGFGGRRIRTGGAGAGGQWTVPTREASAFDQATLKVGMGAFQIENLVNESGGFGLSLGALLGHGDWTLTLTRNASGSFSEVATQPTTLEMTRSFWLALPFLSMEYKFLPFMGIKVGGGMGATLSFGDWEAKSGNVAPGGPLKSTLFPVIQLMVVFGN